MQVQVLVPSQNQKGFTIQVDKNETVASFRSILSKTLKVSIESFLLIALGKILIDRCLDNKPATLYTTYRIKDKTCVFVHLTNLKRKIKPTEKAIKKRKKLTNTTSNNSIISNNSNNIIRDNNIVSLPFGNFICPVCKNKKRQKSCEECGCTKCRLKTGDPLICDQCDGYWHLHCAGLRKIPTEQYWYCPDCYNNDSTVVVGKGKAIKDQTSIQPIINIRDTECVLVPLCHSGKIPGVYCGQSWAYRSFVYDWGVHRSNTFTVCGSVITGAVSMILTQANLIDRDDGYEFTISRTWSNIKNSYNVDLDKNDFSRRNLSLATTCDAPINTQVGAKAINWRKSRPIRVCRSSQLKKSCSAFAPEEGIRYDGIYKLVKYWPYQAKNSNKIVWKFLFRRDDSEAPPWTSVGRSLIKRRGLRMIQDDDNLTERRVKYDIPSRVQKLMAKDRKNKRLWDQIKMLEFWSEYEFLHYIFDEAIVCPSNACSKPIKNPITTPCGHICCRKCLTQSNSDRCFTCRASIPTNSIRVNQTLVKILQLLNWAYDTKPRITMHPIIKIDELDTEYNVDDITIKEEYSQPAISKFCTSKPRKIRIYIENQNNLLKQE